MSLQALVPTKKNKRRPPFQRGSLSRPTLSSVTQGPQIQRPFQPHFVRPPPPLQRPQFVASPPSASITAPPPIPPPTPGQTLQGYLPPKPTAQIPLFTSFGKPPPKRSIRSLRGWLITKRNISSTTRHFKLSPLLFV